MEPELIKQIEGWKKAMTPDVAKKLFLRDSAYNAYKSGNGDIEKVVKEGLEEVINHITVGKMTKDEISSLIGRLEDARIILSSITQGFQIGFAEEKEPEFKKKHLEREAEKKAKSSKPKTVEESLANLGIDFTKLMATMKQAESVESAPKLVQSEEKKSPAPVNTVSANLNKINCPNCNKEILAALIKIHKCG